MVWVWPYHGHTDVAESYSLHTHTHDSHCEAHGTCAAVHAHGVMQAAQDALAPVPRRHALTDFLKLAFRR